MSDSIPPPRASGSFRAAASDEQTNPRQESVIDLILSGINELKASQAQTYTLIMQLSGELTRAHGRIDVIEKRLQYRELSREFGCNWVPMAISIAAFVLALIGLVHR